jgi:L-lactate permease
MDLELDLGGGGINVPLLVLFASFVLTFLVTRTITRMIRAGKGPFHDNVSSGGVHVHHAVPGIILLIVGAFVAVGTSGSGSAWAVVAALLVGVGTSLVLDEFALILHLQDVYWADEGRISVEMVSLAMGCLGLAVCGLTPFDVSGVQGGIEGAVALVLAIATILWLIVVSVMKGKYKLALFGAFIPLCALVAALRLARPESRWAKRHYGPEKLARAEKRTAWYDERFGPATAWVSDFVAGKPSEPDPPAPAPAAARKV